MTGTFKSIPIQGAERDLELRGCAEAEPFALRVIGDSMAPEFQDGHIIIVDPAMPAQSGAYVVIDYQGETTFRQYVVESGRKYLRTLNGGATDVELVEAYQIRGVVVQRAGRRRSDRKHYY
jgi:SOS-response transcriptional repressor LexA